MSTKSELVALSEATLENTPKYTFRNQIKTIKVLSVFGRNSCYFTGAFFDHEVIKQFEFWCPRIRFEHNNDIREGDMIEATLGDFMQDKDCIEVQKITFIKFVML